MNKIITSIALCFATAASAQTANIEVSYVAHHPNMRDGKTDLTNQYVLLANTTESKFYSPITEYNLTKKCQYFDITNQKVDIKLT